MFVNDNNVQNISDIYIDNTSPDKEDQYCDSDYQNSPKIPKKYNSKKNNIFKRVFSNIKRHKIGTIQIILMTGLLTVSIIALCL